MIDCAKARELANAYIDNALDDAECTAYEEHISCCEKCHEEYDMLKKISSDLALTISPLPEGFAKRMHTALVKEQFEAQKKKDKKKFIFPYYRAASVMAAALVIAVVGKFGVYDTYKKVTEDTARIATSIDGSVSSGTETDTTVPADSTYTVNDLAEMPKYTTENSQPAEKTSQADIAPESNSVVIQTEEVPPKTHVQRKTAKEVIPETAETKTEAESIAGAAQKESAPADIIPEAEAAPQIASEIDSAHVTEAAYTEDTDDSVAYAGDNMRTALPAEEDSTSVEKSADASSVASETEASAKKMPAADVTESAVPDHEPAAFSGGGSATVSSPSELVPAEVSIYNSDGSKMMFKKYLLTFLDSSEIADNGEEIVVTVDAEEYGSVMEHLRTNEYVKSVTEGTPHDGTAVINIK